MLGHVHRPIDIIKFDLEGGEYKVLDVALRDPEALADVKYIMFEVCTEVKYVLFGVCTDVEGLAAISLAFGGRR